MTPQSFLLWSRRHCRWQGIPPHFSLPLAAELSVSLCASPSRNTLFGCRRKQTQCQLRPRLPMLSVQCRQPSCVWPETGLLAASEELCKHKSLEVPMERNVLTGVLHGCQVVLGKRPALKMKVMFLLLELMLLSVLQARAKIPLKEYFDAEKLAGKWHTIAIASHSSWIEDFKRNGKMAVSTVKPQQNGEIIIKTLISGPEGCEQRTMVLKRNDQPSQHTNSCFSGFRSSDDGLEERSGTSHNHGEDVPSCRLLDTDYSNHILLLSDREYQGRIISVLFLYSRDAEAKPHMLEKFRDTMSQMGLSEEQMIVLPKTEECTPPSE
nr:lipocalin-like isoform X1 [Anser cygnoides]